MTMVVKLTEQKGPEETEGSSEVTGPVQQGEVRGGFFFKFLFCCFFASMLFAFLAFPIPAGANEWVWNEYWPHLRMVMVISGENGDNGEYGGVEIYSSGKIPLPYHHHHRNHHRCNCHCHHVIR